MRTYPWSWYEDPEIARRERERIFRRAWQYVGRRDELTAPGSFAAAHVGGLPVVLTRDRDDVLRAFANVCRHRGALVAHGTGERGTLQCPYHAWTYGLDGCLRAAPRTRGDAGFATDGLGLVPMAVDTWGPFVFVNPDAGAAPLSEALGDLPAIVAAHGTDVNALRFHHRVEYEIRANWKIAIENYLECYHCQLNHPGFVKLLDEQRQRMEAVGLRLSQFPPIHPDAYTDAAPYDVSESDGVPTAQYHILFPAMKFNVNPGRPNLSIGPLWPVATDRTAAWFDRFFPEGTDEAWIEDMRVFDNQVGAEDTGLVEAVQLGAASGALEHGRLLTRTEALIGGFQDMVRARVEPALGGSD